jgi:hypothetical protein
MLILMTLPSSAMIDHNVGSMLLPVEKAASKSEFLAAI